MTKWIMYPHSKKLFSKLEIDVAEFAQYAGMTPAKLTPGDEIQISWLDNTGATGEVLSIEGEKVTIRIDKDTVTIRPAERGDIVNPPESALRIEPWFIV